MSSENERQELALLPERIPIPTSLLAVVVEPPARAFFARPL